MKATLKNYRQSPRKVRLVADSIRGKSVPIAQHTIRFLGKRAAPAVGKLLDSALANARSSGLSPDGLIIKSITVNKGRVQKRGRPFARGRSGVIRKTASHIEIVLVERSKMENSNSKVQPARTTEVVRSGGNGSSKLKKSNTRMK